MNDNPDIINAGIHDLASLQSPPETRKKETELLVLVEMLSRLVRSLCTEYGVDQDATEINVETEDCGSFSGSIADILELADDLTGGAV